MKRQHGTRTCGLRVQVRVRVEVQVQVDWRGRDENRRCQLAGSRAAWTAWSRLGSLCWTAWPCLDGPPGCYPYLPVRERAGRGAENWVPVGQLSH